MKKISINNKLPEIGKNILVYGTYVGEITNRSSVKGWYHVNVCNLGCYEGIGGDCYAWYVDDIEFWIDLSEIYT